MFVITYSIVPLCITFGQHLISYAASLHEFRHKLYNKHRRTTAGSVSLLCDTTPRSTLVSWLAARPDTEEDLENGRRISGCPSTQHFTLQTHTLPNQPTPCGSRPEFTAARLPHTHMYFFVVFGTPLSALIRPLYAFIRPYPPLYVLIHPYTPLSALFRRAL